MELEQSKQPISPLLSHGNSFQFGYNGVPFALRQNPQDEWWVQYGVCDRPPLSFREECLETARKIRSNTDQPIHVMFSGGVDSEVTLRSFVDAGIKVQAAILRFKNDLNIHDISWAIIVCDSLSVPYQIYDLDILDFWENQAWKYAAPTYCISPQLLSTMWLIDQIPGYPVMGSGECLLVKDVPTDYKPGISPYEESDWHMWEKEKIASWYRHFIVRGRDGCPGFFQYTPEIILSYLVDPFVVRLVNNQITGKLSTESSKLAIYQQHFPLTTRPKYTGFEKVVPQDAWHRQQLRDRFPFADQKVKSNYRNLVERLSSKFNL